MIPIAGIFRGMFLVSILFWYSTSVWKMMDSYFRDEFKKYLVKEKEENKHLEIGISEDNENTLKMVSKMPLENTKDASEPQLNIPMSHNREIELMEKKGKDSEIKNKIHLKANYLDSFNTKKFIDGFDFSDDETCPILNEPNEYSECETP